MTFWRFLVLLAKKYISPIGTLTYTANFAISNTPFDVPKDDIFLNSLLSLSITFGEINPRFKDERNKKHKNLQKKREGYELRNVEVLG